MLMMMMKKFGCPSKHSQNAFGYVLCIRIDFARSKISTLLFFFLTPAACKSLCVCVADIRIILFLAGELLLF